MWQNTTFCNLGPKGFNTLFDLHRDYRIPRYTCRQITHIKYIFKKTKWIDSDFLIRKLCQLGNRLVQPETVSYEKTHSTSTHSLDNTKELLGHPCTIYLAGAPLPKQP